MDSDTNLNEIDSAQPAAVAALMQLELETSDETTLESFLRNRFSTLLFAPLLGLAIYSIGGTQGLNTALLTAVFVSIIPSLRDRERREQMKRVVEVLRELQKRTAKR